nr:TPA_asm: m87.4 sORF 1 [Murid betaherpesvirus 1]DBA08030.1 TPA_asm: m87.4 sORF 1 [Murid betaherpesvirus 1]
MTLPVSWWKAEKTVSKKSRVTALR